MALIQESENLCTNSRDVSKRETLLGALIALGFVLMFAVLVTWHAAQASVTCDEAIYVPSGYTYLHWGDFRLNPEHPPLIKDLGALFLWPMHVWPGDIEVAHETAPGFTDSFTELKDCWTLALTVPSMHAQFAHCFLFAPKTETLRRLGISHPLQLPTTVALEKKDFLNDADAVIFRARLPVMLLGVLLAALIFCWARELWGLWGGVLALALFCSDPNFIAHSSLLTTDVGVTAFMFGTMYFFWRSCRRLTALDAGLFMLFTGLAFVTKFSAGLLPPMFVLAGLGRVFAKGEWPLGGGPRRLATPRAKAAAMAVLIVA